MSVLAVVIALWLLLQLLAVSWPTRGTRPIVVFAAALVGAYGCAVLTFALQTLVNRTVWLFGTEPFEVVVERAGYSYDPVLEEFAKLVPLAVLVVSFACARRQWGLTDYLVLGGALGAGFGFVEVMSSIVASADPAAADPAAADAAGAAGSASTDPLRVIGAHLGWTALAGVGLGLLVRCRGVARLAGTLPILLACALHVRANLAQVRPGHPLALTDDWLAIVAWLLPLAGLAIALLLDARRIRAGKRARPDLLLFAERSGAASALAIADLALLRPPYSSLVVARYVRLRRAVYYAGADLATVDASTRDRSADPDRQLWRLARSIRADLDAADQAEAWQRLDPRRLRPLARSTVAGAGAGAGAGPAGRGGPALFAQVVGVAAAVPVGLFVFAGSIPAFDGLRQAMLTEFGTVIALLATAAGAAFLLWRALELSRTSRRVAGFPLLDAIALVRLNLVGAVGTIAAGVALTGALGSGLAAPTGPVVPGVHLHLIALLPNASVQLLSWLALGFVPVAASRVAPPSSAASAAVGPLGATMLRLAGDRGGPVPGPILLASDPVQPPARLDRSMRELRPSEQRTALLLAQQERFRGRTFRRPDSWSLAAMHVDWVDDAGGRYDAYGDRTSIGSPDGDMRRFLDRLDMHLARDVDYTVIDLTGFARWQIAVVAAHLENPPPNVREHLHKVIRVGF